MSWSKIFAVALNTFREAIRNRILYSVVLFAFILIGVSAVFGSVSIGDQIKVMKDFFLFALSFFGCIAAVTAGGSLLGRELKQKTIYNILSKPVARWQFIIGKQLGLIAVVTTLVSTTGILSLGFIALFEGRFDPLMIQGVALTILELMVVASLTIFFSSLVITTVLAALFTIGVYLTGRSIPYLDYFLKDSGPTALAAKLVDVVVPDLSLLNFADRLVAGIPVSSSEFLFASLYALSWSLLLAVLSTLIFHFRELR